MDLIVAYLSQNACGAVDCCCGDEGYSESYSEHLDKFMPRD